MNGVTSEGSAVHHAPTESQIDPSIATAITTGHPVSAADNAPAYSANAANGEASSGPVTAAPEKGAEVPTTTTTTIITTTTGPPSANGLSPTSPVVGGTAPTSPIVGGEAAPTSALSTTAPVANGVPAEGAAPIANGVPADGAAPAAVPTTGHSALAPAAAGVAGGAAAGAAVAGAGADQEKQPQQEMVLKPKEAKKYQKLLRKEAKNDEQDLASAIKDAQNLEKPLRKATKAEQQSQKRHQSAVHDEHKASKSFNKAKLEYEKAQAALQKALDELDIKKKHTTATQEAFDKAKQRIDDLRNQKVENDKDRARRQASITTTA